MGHIPEQRTEHFLTVEDTDMNTYKGILMDTGFSNQVLDTDVVVGQQHKKTARGNVIKKIKKYSVVQNINRYQAEKQVYS